MAAPRKVAAPKATPAAKPAAKPRAPKAGPKIIRNLRNMPVHLRLGSDPPYRIQLQPRGRQGDTASVPVALQEEYAFLRGVGTLFEVITQTEARKVEYGPVGYVGRPDSATIYREEDTTIQTADNWDGKGRRAPEDRNIHRTGQNLADVPGSDEGLHATIRAGQAEVESNAALPEGVRFDRQVTVERVKGD